MVCVRKPTVRHSLIADCIKYGDRSRYGRGAQAFLIKRAIRVLARFVPALVFKTEINARQSDKAL